jgi:hypothetical protein
MAQLWVEVQEDRGRREDHIYCVRVPVAGDFCELVNIRT